MLAISPRLPVKAEIEGLFQKVGTLDHIVYTAGEDLATVAFWDIITEHFIKAGQLRFFVAFFVAKICSQLPRSILAVMVMRAGTLEKQNWRA